MLKDYRRIVVLTGAGISRSAGLATYRGPGGLWSDPELEALSHIETLKARRDDVCGMFWRFARAIREVRPTAAHRALAAFEAKLTGDREMMIITQNVDGLHQAAGSQAVCEYHGSLAHWRCEICGVKLAPPDTGDPPQHCDELMRPDIVLFGESIPIDAERTAKRVLRDCDLFVAIGTSGTVSPASSFVRWARMNDAATLYLNLEPIDDAWFVQQDHGPADELVPRWFAL
jgi:NAD-dependent deacetylase